MTRLLALIVALVFAVPAYAGSTPATNANITQAGADALKPKIVDAISYFAATMQKSGVTLKQEGDVLVEPAGTYYAVTSPNISLLMPGNITRTVGMVAINAIPTDDPNVFKVAVALPTPMMDTDETGKQVGSLSIGQQTMNGLWNMAAAVFLEMNGSYKDVRIKNAGQGLDVGIPMMTLTSKLTQNGKMWQGPAEAVITNYTHKDAKGSYQVGSLRIRTDVRELDLNAPARATSGTGMNAMQALFSDYLTRYANAVDATIAADNIAFQNPTRTGTIKTGTLQTSMKNLRGDTSDATWNLGLDGITSGNADQIRFTPTRAAMKGSGNKVPVAALSRIVEGGDTWMQILGRAGSTVNIENLVVDAPAYGMDAKGNFKADTGAPLGGIGDLNISLRGLQELNAWLASGQASNVVGVNMLPPQVLAGLAIVQMVGKDGKDAQGRATKTFDLKMSEDGKILVNGADMSAITATAPSLLLKPAGPR